MSQEIHIRGNRIIRSGGGIRVEATDRTKVNIADNDLQDIEREAVTIETRASRPAKPDPWFRRYSWGQITVSVIGALIAAIVLAGLTLVAPWLRR